MENGNETLESVRNAVVVGDSGTAKPRARNSRKPRPPPQTRQRYPRAQKGVYRPDGGFETPLSKAIADKKVR